MLKRITYIFIPAVLFFLSCSTRHENGGSARQPLAVSTMTVCFDSVSERHHYTGEVRSAATVDIRYAMGGKVVGINVVTGQTVRRGDVLAVIDSTEAHSFHESAMALLRQAEDAYRRVSGVHEKGVVTDVKWVEIETQLEQARQNERAAQKMLADCRLTAPIDGVVSGVNVNEGQLMLPEQTLLTLTDTHNLEMVFSVPEQDMPDIQAGETVETVIPAIRYRARATVLPKTVVANPLTHTYLLRAKMERQTDGRPTAAPLPGMLGTVHFFTGGGRLVTLPGECVHTTPEGPAVWVVEDGIAHRRRITVSGYTAGGIAVSSGLTEGDMVITAGYQKLYEGAEIQEKR